MVRLVFHNRLNLYLVFPDLIRDPAKNPLDSGSAGETSDVRRYNGINEQPTTVFPDLIWDPAKNHWTPASAGET